MKKSLLFFIPSIEGGGVEKNLFIVANHLAKKNDKIQLITASTNFKYKFNNKINIIGPKRNFINYGRKIKYIICLYILFREILRNNHKVVFSFQANIYCIILCKIFSIKVISRSNSSPSGWSTNFLKKFLFKILLNFADKIMVNSLEFKKELKKKFNVNSICIYNPLNLIEIKNLSKKKVKQIYSKNSQFKIMNIGRFTDQKDQITLIRAINEIKNKINFELIIMGKGKNKKILENLIKDFKLSKKVKLLNFKKNPYPFLKQSNLFILSSKYEGLPNVLLESLALKKFIISSKCPTGPSEILDNGKGGLLFKCGKYKELAKQILYFSNNQKTCNSKLKYALKRMSRFDYKINLLKYEKLINSYLEII